MDLRTRYQNHFSGIKAFVVVVPVILIALGYLAAIIGAFALLGPVSNIFWGWPIFLSLPLGFAGAALVAWLLWPLFDWAMERLLYGSE